MTHLVQVTVSPFFYVDVIERDGSRCRFIQTCKPILSDGWVVLKDFKPDPNLTAQTEVAATSLALKVEGQFASYVHG